MLLVCFVHLSPVAFYKMFWKEVLGLYGVVLCTVAVLANNELRVVAFADVFDESFDCTFVVSRVLFVFTLSLRCWW